MCAAVVLRSQDCLRKPFPPRWNAAAGCNPNNAFMSRSGNRTPVNQDRKSQTFDASVPKNNLVMGQVKILKRGEALPALSNEFTKPDPPVVTVTEKPVQKPVPRVTEKAVQKPVPRVTEKPVQKPVPRVTEKPVLSKKLGFVDRRDEDGIILCSTGRMGPEPEAVRMQIKAFDFYAGLSPTMASPPPSSVPFPSFFSKMKAKTKVDAATNDILRLLKIDLS